MEELKAISTFRLKQTFNKIIETIHKMPELQEALEANYPVGAFVDAWLRADLPFEVTNSIMIIFLYSLGFPLESISPYLDFDFYDCSKELISIKLPNNIINLPPNSFANCINLETIVLPRKLQIIHDGAFRFCGKLKYIQLPSSLNKIEEKVFFGCGDLTEIHYDGTKEQWIKISKDNYWDGGSRIHKIICTDGDIEIE